MTTVYQLGNSVIMKDMIFGWCISRPDIGTVLCSDLPTESLKELAEADYPAYLSDFKKDMGVILEMRLFLEEKKKAEDIKQDSKFDQVSAEQEEANENRKKDIINLAMEIRDNISPVPVPITFLSNTGHCYAYHQLIPSKGVISILDSNRKFLEQFDDALDAAEFIARRFW